MRHCLELEWSYEQSGMTSLLCFRPQVDEVIISEIVVFLRVQRWSNICLHCISWKLRFLVWHRRSHTILDPVDCGQKGAPWGSTTSIISYPPYHQYPSMVRALHSKILILKGTLLFVTYFVVKPTTLFFIFLNYYLEIKLVSLVSLQSC